MSSLLENYKKVNDLDYESDLNVIQQLYKNNESYQKKYSFEEFVTYATENSVNKLDGSLSEYTATPKYTQQKFGDLLKQSMILKADSTIVSKKLISMKVCFIFSFLQIIFDCSISTECFCP